MPPAAVNAEARSFDHAPWPHAAASSGLIAAAGFAHSDRDRPTAIRLCPTNDDHRLRSCIACIYRRPPGDRKNRQVARHRGGTAAAPQPRHDCGEAGLHRGRADSGLEPGEGPQQEAAELAEAAELRRLHRAVRVRGRPRRRRRGRVRWPSRWGGPRVRRCAYTRSASPPSLRCTCRRCGSSR